MGDTLPPRAILTCRKPRATSIASCSIGMPVLGAGFRGHRIPRYI
jgi:hypothetical protein